MKAHTEEEKYEMIWRKKKGIGLSELCKGCPVELLHYLTLCRSLRFSQEPDYPLLTNLFSNCIKRHNLDPLHLNYAWK